jgi:hypothetical protein
MKKSLVYSLVFLGLLIFVCILVPSVGAIPDPIFSDDFETGDYGNWGQVVSDGGDLSVTSGAALEGSYGMQVVVNDANNVYLGDFSPALEPRYRARFYFDPNTIDLPNGNTFEIFVGYNVSRSFQVTLKRYGGEYRLIVSAWTDGEVKVPSSEYSIGDHLHAIEIDYRVATSDGANDGYLTLWIDGVLAADLTGVDDDTRQVDYVRLGVTYPTHPETSGTVYFDGFISDRSEYIGLDPDIPTYTPTNSITPTETLTPTPTNTNTPTETPTSTNTPTETPTSSETPTSTFTPTPTDTFTPTFTYTPSFTLTPSKTLESTYDPNEIIWSAAGTPMAQIDHTLTYGDISIVTPLYIILGVLVLGGIVFGIFKYMERRK